MVRIGSHLPNTCTCNHFFSSDVNHTMISTVVVVCFFLLLSSSLKFTWQSEVLFKFFSHDRPIWFQAWDTLQNSIDNRSTDKVETCIEWQQYFSQFQNMTDAVPCHIHLALCLWIMDPHSKTAKNNTSHRIEVLPLDTTLFIERPYYQQGSLCQDPAGSWTTRKPPDHHK